MNRRKFILASGMVAGSGMISAAPLDTIVSDSLPIIRPKALKKGDTIGLITPASAISRGAFETALSNLKELGFKVRYSDNIRVRKGFLAGTDTQRIDDIHSMFEDATIDGIVCARGGYGSGRLLPDLNYDLIKSNPKVLVGYSDITALLYGIHKQTGLVCFHGPVGASTFTDFTKTQFENVLMKGKKRVVIECPKKWKALEDSAFQTHEISHGTARGPLVGGNLSLMVSLIGTPHDIDFEGKIVFIEEIGESIYRVDRMLTQLLLSGKLDKASGIAIGIFKGCDAKIDDPGFGQSTGIRELLLDRLGALNIPVLYGLPIGHIQDNATLPFGIEAELDVSQHKLTLLSAGVK